jgi:hypothetical protein
MLELGPELFELLNAKQWVGNQQPVVYGKGGLTILEIRVIEAKLGFQVPDDFAFLLQNVRDPGGVLFPWANLKKQKYEDIIDWVRKGIEFSVEKDDLWLNRWGERPEALSDALEKARTDFSTWPKLLPIYGHRFLAADPCRTGNPVFSIMGTDIIYYGANLASYLVHEFVEQGADKHALHTQDAQRIDIWSDFIERRSDFLSTRRNREKKGMEIAAALQANLRDQVPRPLIELELKAEGHVLVDGELFAGRPALEAKLKQLTQRTPPPDLRVGHLNDSVNADILQQLQRLLGQFGYRTICSLRFAGPMWPQFMGRYGV